MLLLVSVFMIRVVRDLCVIMFALDQSLVIAMSCTFGARLMFQLPRLTQTFVVAAVHWRLKYQLGTDLDR